MLLHVVTAQPVYTRRADALTLDLNDAARDALHPVVSIATVVLRSRSTWRALVASLQYFISLTESNWKHNAS